MPELFLIAMLTLPQVMAGFYAKSLGKNFWFWYFISFLIPVISLIVLLFLDKENDQRKGYGLADHVEKNKTS